ncbi:hypothetical protein ACP275_05G062500 [Erythranthe tilingii]
MVLQSAQYTSALIREFPHRKYIFSPPLSPSPPFCFCPCSDTPLPRRRFRRRGIDRTTVTNVRWALLQPQSSIDNVNHHLRRDAAAAASQGGAKDIILKRFVNQEESNSNHASSSGINADSDSNYYSPNFGQDPIVEKLRTQLGVIHLIPSPPINPKILGLFVVFFFVGVIWDKIWTPKKKDAITISRTKARSWMQVPNTMSMLLEKDLQRKESVEWVNMVLGKLWKVYRGGIENWIIGLMQPVIDNLKKPDYVERVEIKQFSLGDEPLSIRSIERRTSRRNNDLQYQIGIRYTGGARMLLLLSLKFGIFPISLPVGVRDFDIDGELWVKLRLIPTDPWIGSVSWAFVSLPKIKFQLSPFRLFNLMAIPVLSMFLQKLLTEDLPRLFVRPKKIVLDFQQKGKAGGPVTNDPKSGDIQEGNYEFAGELSVTLLDAQKLTYIFYGKTDPYVVLKLGNQVIRSKRNSQTTVIGPPGQPIWNQDFFMLVSNPTKEKLRIEVKDSLGFTDLTVGTAEIDLGSLKDTVPEERAVVLQGGWSPFGKGSVGEILLRLTYKAYVEDEEDEKRMAKKVSDDIKKSENKSSDSDDSRAAIFEERAKDNLIDANKESFVDLLAALLVSEEFKEIVASETSNKKSVDPGIDSSELTGQKTPPEVDSDRIGGSVLLWLALFTSISVLIALNTGGSSLFNP